MKECAKRRTACNSLVNSDHEESNNLNSNYAFENRLGFKLNRTTKKNVQKEYLGKTVKENYKTELCKNWIKTQSCCYGAKC